MKNEGIATAAWVLCQSDFDFVLFVTLAPKNQNWDSLLQLTSLSKSRGSDSCHREKKTPFFAEFRKAASFPGTRLFANDLILEVPVSRKICPTWPMQQQVSCPTANLKIEAFRVIKFTAVWVLQYGCCSMGVAVWVLQ